jgi:hypothetical protein
VRFERIPRAGSHKIRSRPGERADFLARLWALFGEPDPADGGFSYAIRDRETGLEFEAYSGASGPSYGADHRPAYGPVLDAFDALLDATEPAECELRVGVEAEYGGGFARLGCKNGKLFDRSEPLSAKELHRRVIAAKKRLSKPAEDPEDEYVALQSVLPLVESEPHAREVGCATWVRLFDAFERWLATKPRPGPMVDLLPDEIPEAAEDLEIDMAPHADRWERMLAIARMYSG